ncbi:MAG: NAD(+) diphosphatase [Spirochaetales bacterium]|jgi:NAD+ diphosphatase
MTDAQIFGYALFCGPDLILPQDEVGAAKRLPIFEEPPIPGFSGLSGMEDLSGAIGRLFKFSGKTYLALELDEDQTRGIPGAVRLPLRQYIGIASQDTIAFALKAKSYAHWSSVARFCSFCGAPLTDGRGRETEGARVCDACGRAHFPRISPAVIVLVNRGDEILLAHNAKFPTGRHGLIAGFVELGETLEETVHREVMEEAGIEVGEPRYVKSQPWPFPDSLMIAFEAEYKSGEARPDGEEIDHLGWFSLNDLPDIPPRGSVARYLIDRFIDAPKPAANS